MTDNKDSTSVMMNVQRQLLMEQAKTEQEFAKIDRIMKGRQVAFALATEAVKSKASMFTIDDIITEARKIEAYLSEGSEDYLALAKKLNDIDEEQDKLVLASSSVN